MRVGRLYDAAGVEEQDVAGFEDEGLDPVLVLRGAVMPSGIPGLLASRVRTWPLRSKTAPRADSKGTLHFPKSAPLSDVQRTNISHPTAELVFGM
ncbi:hypothetical protein GCM10014715_65710 [Streptomyces spiralis]|uniref:Uncharacterized protein n=1 Tax=Streptomyces spiralis TaxID=66376 RepID=A0A919E1H6_9ACTN|nr:hypothetical protein GCM10014715_65710 [Streptomyces spiralis]